MQGGRCITTWQTSNACRCREIIDSGSGDTSHTQPQAQPISSQGLQRTPTYLNRALPGFEVRPMPGHGNPTAVRDLGPHQPANLPQMGHARSQADSWAVNAPTMAAAAQWDDNPFTCPPAKITATGQAQLSLHEGRDVRPANLSTKHEHPPHACRNLPDMSGPPAAHETHNQRLQSGKQPPSLHHGTSHQTHPSYSAAPDLPSCIAAAADCAASQNPRSATDESRASTPLQSQSSESSSWHAWLDQHEAQLQPIGSTQSQQPVPLNIHAQPWQPCGYPAVLSQAPAKSRESYAYVLDRHRQPQLSDEERHPTTLHSPSELHIDSQPPPWSQRQPLQPHSHLPPEQGHQDAPAHVALMSNEPHSNVWSRPELYSCQQAESLPDCQHNHDYPAQHDTQESSSQSHWSAASGQSSDDGRSPEIFPGGSFQPHLVNGHGDVPSVMPACQKPSASSQQANSPPLLPDQCQEAMPAASTLMAQMQHK